MSSTNPQRLHVACIMDGNGRWASRRGLPRTEGHTAGEAALADIVRASADRPVGWLTAFGFSTENWVRPRTEVRHILSLHRRLFARTEEMNSRNARTRWIGRPFNEKGSRTPVYVQKAIAKAISDTQDNTGLTVTIAFDYGSRAELVRAAQRAMAAGPVSAASITQNLYDPTLPHVDVLVRTSGEARISNFLLWQITGARVFFTERTWPDFDKNQLDEALALASGHYA
ncbi:MAG: polyprenyl diphosphate synthase [Ilumatobacteraceae bacterium]|jgi:undecaprenyl diphosphate synthase|nr:polyprenyl diphosphate synthase [Ilumatobacteraceae bacterium]